MSCTSGRAATFMSHAHLVGSVLFWIFLALFLPFFGTPIKPKSGQQYRWLTNTCTDWTSRLALGILFFFLLLGFNRRNFGDELGIVSPAFQNSTQLLVLPIFQNIYKCYVAGKSEGESLHLYFSDLLPSYGSPKLNSEDIVGDQGVANPLFPCDRNRAFERKSTTQECKRILGFVHNTSFNFQFTVIAFSEDSFVSPVADHQPLSHPNGLQSYLISQSACLFFHHFSLPRHGGSLLMSTFKLALHDPNLRAKLQKHNEGNSQISNSCESHHLFGSQMRKEPIPVHDVLLIIFFLVAGIALQLIGASYWLPVWNGFEESKKTLLYLSIGVYIIGVILMSVPFWGVMFGLGSISE
jgi:hypothetical protein